MGADKFIKDICSENTCFLCGLPYSDELFNMEHVIPDWIHNSHKLPSYKTILGNETTYPYASHKIPCCKSCNSMLGERVEKPMSKILQHGIAGLVKHINEHGIMLPYLWLALIFIKHSIHDKKLRKYRDRRMPDIKLSEDIEWNEFYHVYTLVRTLLFAENANIGKGCIGSFLVLSAMVDDSKFHSFDYADFTLTQSAMIRYNDVIIAASFNDACGAINGIRNRMSRVKGPLGIAQAREILLDMAVVNVHMKNRPTFSYKVSWDGTRHELCAHVPDKFEMYDVDMALRGELSLTAYRGIIDTLRIDDSSSTPEVIEKLRTGTVSFLFDANGEFIRDSLQFTPVPRITCV